MEGDFVQALRNRDQEAEALLVDQLVSDFGEGRDRGLVLVSRAYRSRLLSYLQRICGGDEQAALEAWNDTLLRVHSRVATYDPSRSRFMTWVFNQGRYAALDILRRDRRFRQAGHSHDRSDEIFEMPAPATASERRCLMKAMSELTETERHLLTLRFVEGFQPAEIARTFGPGGIPDTQIRVYIARAVKRLRDRYLERLANRVL